MQKGSALRFAEGDLLFCLAKESRQKRPRLPSFRLARRREGCASEVLFRRLSQKQGTSAKVPFRRARRKMTSCCLHERKVKGKDSSEKPWFFLSRIFGSFWRSKKNAPPAGVPQYGNTMRIKAQARSEKRSRAGRQNATPTNIWKPIDSMSVLMYNVPSRELPNGRCKRCSAHISRKSVSARKSTGFASGCGPEMAARSWPVAA